MSRTSRRPVSSPTGAAPGRHSFSPLYWGGLWLEEELVPSDQREHRIERDCLAFPFPPSTLAGLARGELDRGIRDDETDAHQLVRAAVGARLCLEMRPIHDDLLSTFHHRLGIARPSGLLLTRKSIPRSPGWGT